MGDFLGDKILNKYKKLDVDVVIPVPDTSRTSAMQVAYKLGVKRVEWEVLDWNKKAIDFYNKNGAKIFDDWKIVKMNSKSMINFLAKNKS